MKALRNFKNWILVKMGLRMSIKEFRKMEEELNDDSLETRRKIIERLAEEKAPLIYKISSDASE